MTAQSTQARIPAAADAAASGADQEPVHGAEIVVPLNRLKASPKNARKTPHNAATIEAFAASIKIKGVLQPPVVEIERGEDGAATGNFLVTIGEGRRQGLRLLAKRKQIKRTHALALQVFYPAWGTWTPLQLRMTMTGLERLAPGVSDSPAGRRVADRLEAWGARLPEEARDLWGVLITLPPSELLDLMACCAGVGLYAVRDPHDRKPDALAHAEVLATITGLDMTGTLSATASSYFSRVSKARLLEAVIEATTPEEAGRIAGFKKGDMAEAAERLVEGKGWLPSVLRTDPAVDPDDPEPEGEGTEQSPPDADAYRFAAE